MSYLIKHKTERLYIHYHSGTDAYIVRDRKLGACKFNNADGKNIMKLGCLEKDWDLYPIHNVSVNNSTLTKEKP